MIAEVGDKIKFIRPYEWDTGEEYTLNFQYTWDVWAINERPGSGFWREEFIIIRKGGHMARKTAKPGMKVRVTRRCRDPYGNCSYVEKGAILTLMKYNSNASAWGAKDSDGEKVYVERENFEIIESINKEVLETELKAAKTAIIEVEAKLAYLKETGSAEFDDTEFKCYRALQALKSDSTDIEKARVIAQLVKEG